MDLIGFIMDAIPTFSASPPPETSATPPTDTTFQNFLKRMTTEVSYSPKRPNLLGSSNIKDENSLKEKFSLNVLGSSAIIPPDYIHDQSNPPAQEGTLLQLLKVLGLELKMVDGEQSLVSNGRQEITLLDILKILGMEEELRHSTTGPTQANLLLETKPMNNPMQPLGEEAQLITRINLLLSAERGLAGETMMGSSEEELTLSETLRMLGFGEEAQALAQDKRIPLAQLLQMLGFDKGFTGGLDINQLMLSGEEKKVALRQILLALGMKEETVELLLKGLEQQLRSDREVLPLTALIGSKTGGEGAEVTTTLTSSSHTQTAQAQAILNTEEVAHPLPSRSAATDAEIISQIIDKARLNLQQGLNRINLQLEPPSLGRLQMNITLRGDQIMVRIATEHQVVKAAIESNIHQLREALAEQGMRMERFSVFVGHNPAYEYHTPQEGRFGLLQAMRQWDGALENGAVLTTGIEEASAHYFYTQNKASPGGIDLFA